MDAQCSRERRRTGSRCQQQVAGVSVLLERESRCSRRVAQVPELLGGVGSRCSVTSRGACVLWLHGGGAQVLALFEGGT